MRTLAAVALLFSFCWSFAAEQPVSLQTAGGENFRALYDPATSARAAVIVLTGMSGKALAEAIQHEFTAHQYGVLTVDGTVQRTGIEQLRAAVAFLQAKGLRLIAIVAYDRAANIANDYLTQVADNGIAAWACISVAGGELRDAAKLRVPILDIYGAKDSREIVEKADARVAILRKIRGSAQIELAGADHQYANEEAGMATAVRQFLDQRFR